VAGFEAPNDSSKTRKRIPCSVPEHSMAGAAAFSEKISLFGVN
jgi:hypothetical protein